VLEAERDARDAFGCYARGELAASGLSEPLATLRSARLRAGVAADRRVVLEA
jgi:hypothetical protein